jgi:hypothetical protein
MLVSVGLAALLLGGCGGTIDDDHGYDSGQSGYPQYKALTLILRVQTPAGNPLGGVTVLVDGEADSTLTDSVFHPLGSGYPDAWQGWLANWTSDAYQVVMNYRGDSDQFEIRVQKPGWTDDSTIVQVSDDEPDDIFIRDVMTMHRLTSASVQAAGAPHYAEVLSVPKGVKLQSSHGPLKTIRSSDDRLTGK